jgi:DNA-directed RNA polymerase sigma subunit (sigma70/sigma32)
MRQVLDRIVMNPKIQAEGLNRFLTTIYGKETRLNTLLANLGFSSQQIEILLSQHVQQVVTSYIAFLKTQIVAGLGSERLYKIVSRRFALDGELPQTLQSLGEELGISRERVRQLEQKVLKRCRAKLKLESWEAGLHDIASSLLSASS